MNEPPPLPANPVPRKTSGMAVASLILGIVSLLGGAILIVPMVLAIVFGHIAHSRIKKDPSLDGGGLAIAGFAMGYASIIFGIFMAGLLAAMAIPAFNKVRETSMQKVMQNDARQIAMAAQQLKLEQGEKPVVFTIDPATGDISGPIAQYVPHVTAGTKEVDGTIDDASDTFSLTNPSLMKGRVFVFDSEGNLRN